MSPGLRCEDLPRLTAPDPKVLAFLPRATKQSAVKIAGGTERMLGQRRLAATTAAG